MYVFYHGADPEGFDSLQSMAAHEHGKRPTFTQPIFRGVATETGHRPLNSEELGEYLHELDIAVGMWNPEFRFEPTIAGLTYARKGTS